MRKKRDNIISTKWYRSNVDKKPTCRREIVTDTKRLYDIIACQGIKKAWLAKEMGLSGYGLYRKITNLNQFNAGEIQRLCDLLKIYDLKEKENIFFAKDVENTSTK